MEPISFFNRNNRGLSDDQVRENYPAILAYFIFPATQPDWEPRFWEYRPEQQLKV